MYTELPLIHNAPPRRVALRSRHHHFVQQNPQKTPTPPQARSCWNSPGSIWVGGVSDTVNAWSWCAWRFWAQRAWPEVPMGFVITGGVSRVSRLSRWQQPIHFYLILFCLPSVFYLIFFLTCGLIFRVYYENVQLSNSSLISQSET